MDVPYAPLGGEASPRWPNSSGPWRPLSRRTGAPPEEDALWVAVARPGPPWRLPPLPVPAGGAPLSDEMTSEMLSVFATHSMLGRRRPPLHRAALRPGSRPAGEAAGKADSVVHPPHWQDSLRALLNFRPDVEIVGCDMALDADVLPSRSAPMSPWPGGWSAPPSTAVRAPG